MIKPIPKKQKRLPKRAALIQQADKEAVLRDGYCLCCRRRTGLTGAHLLVRNDPRPRFRPADKAHILTLCAWCHWKGPQSYDSNHSDVGKIAWLRSKGLVFWARLIEWIVGITEGEEPKMS